ncbi:MAG: ion transporter [Lachnospiraceae bacterium]|nr:ion transporter [Lachnospiraceae bacterium]
MKRKIFDIIQIGDKSNLISRLFDIFIALNIFMNIIAAFLLTVDEKKAYFPVFHGIEIGTTLIFCVEYILRIWTADELYKEDGRIKSRLHFLISYDGIVDLFTILPVFFLTGFIVFRMLRVIRIFHLFRINKQYDSFHVIATVFREKRNQIFSSVVIILILMLGSSLCMYSAEHEAQPEVFKNAFSGLWWAVSTVLTVGYGDIYPVTILGKGMAIIIAFLGVGAVAIPTGIVSAGFVEQYTKQASDSARYKKMDIQDVIEILIDKRLAGRTLSELREKEGLTSYLVLRNGLTVLPKDDMVLKKDDILIAKMEK